MAFQTNRLKSNTPASPQSWTNLSKEVMAPYWARFKRAYRSVAVRMVDSMLLGIRGKRVHRPVPPGRSCAKIFNTMGDVALHAFRKVAPNSDHISSTAVIPVTSALQPPVSVPFSQTGQALTAGSGAHSTQQNAVFSLQTSSSTSPVLSVQQTLSGQPIDSSFIVPASTNTTFTLSAPRALFRINFSWPTTS